MSPKEPENVRPVSRAQPVTVITASFVDAAGYERQVPSVADVFRHLGVDRAPRGRLGHAGVLAAMTFRAAEVIVDENLPHGTDMVAVYPLGERHGPVRFVSPNQYEVERLRDAMTRPGEMGWEDAYRHNERARFRDAMVAAGRLVRWIDEVRDTAVRLGLIASAPRRGPRVGHVGVLADPGVPVGTARLLSGAFTAVLGNVRVWSSAATTAMIEEEARRHLRARDEMADAMSYAFGFWTPAVERRAACRQLATLCEAIIPLAAVVKPSPYIERAYFRGAMIAAGNLVRWIAELPDTAVRGLNLDMTA